MLEAGAGGGKSQFQVLKALDRLGAEVARRAGEFPIRRHAELPRQVDRATWARCLHDVRVAARGGFTRTIDASPSLDSQ